MTTVADFLTPIGNNITQAISAGLNGLTWADNVALPIGSNSRYRIMHDGSVLQFGPGVSTDMWYDLAGIATPDHPRSVVYEMCHFTPNTYNVDNWTMSGTGTESKALGNETNGVLILTTDAHDLDDCQIRQPAEAWKLASGKRLVFECNVKMSEATQSALMFGFTRDQAGIIANYVAGGAGIFDDGIVFYKAEDSTDIKLITRKNDTETVSSALATVGTSYVRYGFVADPTGVTPYINGVAGTAQTTNVVDDEELTLVFDIETGSAAAITLSIDWYAIALEV